MSCSPRDVAIVFGARGPTVISISTNGDEDDTAQGFGAAATQTILAKL